MPFKYTLTFTSHGVDESTLRTAIESLGIIDLAISRGPMGTEAIAGSPIRRVTPLQEKILGVLSDNQPHRKYELTDTIDADAGNLTKSLEVLVAAGLVRKFKHGIYGSPTTSEAAANALPPRMNKTTAVSTFGQVVKMVSEHPATAVQIRERFGVTRQRVEQILSKAEDRGLIRRFETTGERGQYVYLSADAALSEIMERTPALSESRRRLLSSMAPGKLYSVTGLAQSANLPNTTQAKTWLIELSKWGLVYHFSIGVRMFCGITPVGLDYPDYDREAEKALPADFIEDIGEIKARFLQVMRLLGGQAKTIEITYALGEGIFGDAAYSSGQVVQQLQLSGLVEKASEKGKGKGHRFYRLTKTGEYVAALIDQFVSPPSLEMVRSNIKSRFERKSEQLRNQWGGYSLPPTYRAILAVVVEEGKVSTQVIPGKMAVQFANPRSINLAVKTLEDRGYLRREGKEGKNGIIWSATEKGRAEHRPAVA